MLRTVSILAALAVFSDAAQAQQAFGPPAFVAQGEPGDTAWMLAASVLAFLAIPGLALLYAGRVEAKNATSVALQVGAVASLASVTWVLVGYTLAFGETTGGWLGNGRAWMMIMLEPLRTGTAVPESTFALFQMALAAFAAALMAGAWVGRARFGWVLAFCAIWGLLVYAPVAHWIWGGGWLSASGVTDYAGGLVVHATAGVSALVVALLIGRQRSFKTSHLIPAHAPALTMAGLMLLWVGWFGISGGLALAATDDASAAIINIHVGAVTAALVWILTEKVKRGKSTAAGFAAGALAGIATLAPAAGFISPGAAVLMGITGALVCYAAVVLLKNRLGIDDTLSVFALHGIAGITGTVFTALFASADLGELAMVPASA